MAQVGRPGFSLQQKKELWQRWKSGESVYDIARALGKSPSSIHWVFRSAGGIPPASRVRAPRSLSSAEREEISRGLVAGQTLRRIADRLGRAPSTISREVARNGGRSSYRAVRADERAWAQAKRPKVCRLAKNRVLQALVAQLLHDDWSPEQIAGWLRKTYPNDPHMRVSIETIYRTLFLQARGVLKRELLSHLRRHKVMRCSKHASTRGARLTGIPNAVSIRQRPASVETRSVPGHWEGDLITGIRTTHIATLVERHSRFVMLVKIDGKNSDGVVAALIREAGRLPAELMTSLTWDRGMELAAHRHFTAATNAAVYFADPSSPWQRGTNENMNGLLRQYLPKGSDLSRHSQTDLHLIADKLNRRPRKVLGFSTPIDRLRSHGVALTG